MKRKIILTLLMIPFVIGILITIATPESSELGIWSHRGSWVIGFVAMFYNHYSLKAKKDEKLSN